MTNKKKDEATAQKYAEADRAKIPMKETAADRETRDKVFKACGDELLSFIERQEHVIEQQKDRAADRKAIKTEAKSRGYDVGVIDSIIKERALDTAGRERVKTRQGILETYRAAIGMEA